MQYTDHNTFQIVFKIGILCAMLQFKFALMVYYFCKNHKNENINHVLIRAWCINPLINILKSWKVITAYIKLKQFITQ